MTTEHSLWTLLTLAIFVLIFFMDGAETVAQAINVVLGWVAVVLCFTGLYLLASFIP